MDAVGHVPDGVENSNVAVMGVCQEETFAELVPVAPAFQRLKQWQLQVKGLSSVYDQIRMYSRRSEAKLNIAVTR